METNNNISRDNKIKREIFSWLKVLIFAVLIAVFINNVLIVNASVPTGSMRNTIAEQSRLVAFRLAYLFSPPDRFDVVVFRFPDDESLLFVKRVIGLPGERVDIINGQVFINESAVPLDEWYLLEPALAEAGRTFVVPEDSFFVLGDNRNDSNDSRGWINTFLPLENILGRALFSYFPTIGIIR